MVGLTKYLHQNLVAIMLQSIVSVCASDQSKVLNISIQKNLFKADEEMDFGLVIIFYQKNQIMTSQNIILDGGYTSN